MPITERLYLVTDRHLCGGDEEELVRRVAAALAGVPRGAMLVQLREKDLDDDALLRLANLLRPVTRDAGARLLVNGRVGVAVEAHADGVHQPDGALDVDWARAAFGGAGLVGASTHSPEQAARAAKAGADLVLIGPVWDTPSKAGMGAPLGVEAVGAAREAASKVGRATLFAIGGIEGPERAAEAVRAGAAGVAVVRAVLGASEPGVAAAALLTAVEGALAETPRGP